MQKIMLVEDDQTMVSLLTTLLSMEGYQVTTPKQNHPDGLLQAFLSERPQIALVDVNLQTGSGIDLVREIRQAPEIEETRIIMFSGLNFEAECIEAGADGFMLKPFMPDELVQMLHDCTGPSFVEKEKKKSL